MKPGELVELSAYGNKLKMFRAYRARIGILVEVKNIQIGGDFLVQWHGLTEEGLPMIGFGETQLMQRKDIKKVK
jgi:hypothetical protein